VLSVSADLPYFGFIESDFQGRHCLVACIGYSGEFGYEIVIAPDHASELWDAVRGAGADDGLEECGFTAVNTLRIEAGHILFSNELASLVTPHEIGFARLVERYRDGSPRPRAQTHAPQRRLCGLLLDAPVMPAAVPDLNRVRDDYAVVTSACRSPLFDRWIGLGFVSDKCRYPGTRVRMDASAHASVARLPFYDPGKRLPRLRP